MGRGGGWAAETPPLGLSCPSGLGSDKVRGQGDSLAGTWHSLTSPASHGCPGTFSSLQGKWLWGVETRDAREVGESSAGHGPRRWPSHLLHTQGPWDPGTLGGLLRWLPSPLLSLPLPFLSFPLVSFSALSLPSFLQLLLLLPCPSHSLGPFPVPLQGLALWVEQSFYIKHTPLHRGQC